MSRIVSLVVTLGCFLVLTGCGKPKPKYRVAPLEEESSSTTEGVQNAPSSAGEGDKTDDQTTSTEDGAESDEPTEPEDPPSPRPSILVKVMTDPLQEALQSNMAALQAVMGAVTKQAGIEPPPAESAKPDQGEESPKQESDENATSTEPADDSSTDEAQPASDAEPSKAAAEPN
ncbi:MAG: hypothetical protein AB7U73_15460 [Pirellulales bacterium]